MALKTIETRAIVSAEDKTGATFSQIAQKLRGLEDTAARAGRQSAAVSKNVSGALAQSNRAFAAAAAAGSVIGTLAVRAAARASGAVHEALTTYESVDDSRRLVKALLEQSEGESQKMLLHAMDLGGATKFGPKEVELAYKELAGRIHNSKVIEGITDVAVQLAQALGSDLPTAVKVLENVLFATGVNVENATDGLKAARLYSAQLMKTSEARGLHEP
jgi:hypothetical protein